MPDIFDTIAPQQASQGDIFDQVDIPANEQPVVTENPGTHPTYSAPTFNANPFTALLRGINAGGASIMNTEQNLVGKFLGGSTEDTQKAKDIVNNTMFKKESIKPSMPGTPAGVTEDIGRTAVGSLPVMAGGAFGPLGMGAAGAVEAYANDQSIPKAFLMNAALAKLWQFGGSLGAKAFVDAATKFGVPEQVASKAFLERAGSTAGGGLTGAATSKGDPASIVQGAGFNAAFPSKPFTPKDLNPFSPFSGPDKSLDTQIYESVNNGIQKGIRPSVAGRQTLDKKTKFDQGAVDAVKDIVANKGKLQITGDDGKPLDNPLSGGVKGFAQAIQQRMDDLASTWKDLASQAGEEGATISIDPYLEKINKMLGDQEFHPRTGEAIMSKEGQIFQTEHPADYAKVKAIRDGLQMRGDLDPSTALEKIQEWNADLKPGYNSGFKYGSARSQNVVKGLVEDLRADLDKSITNSTGEQFQPLRTLWGSYKSLTKDVMNRATVAGRTNPKGIWNFLDAMGNAELISAATTGNLPLMAKGAVMKLGKFSIERANNHNNIINKMFSKVDSLMQKSSGVEQAPLAPKKVTPEVKQKAKDQINEEWQKNIFRNLN